MEEKRLCWNLLILMRCRQITGHGLELLKDLPLKDLFLQRTALDNQGLAGLFTEEGRWSFCGLYIDCFAREIYGT